jgi:hypothetical protein
MINRTKELSDAHKNKPQIRNMGEGGGAGQEMKNGSNNVCTCE